MHKHTVSLCILMVLLALAPITCAALSYSVKISAPPALSTLLQQYLPLNHADPSLEPAVLESLQVATPDAARRLLETEGYFSPEVKVWRDDAAAPTIHVDVDPGTPVTVATVSLSLTGPIHDDADYAARYQALIAKWPLAVGQVFRQADWDAGKQQALAALLADRYPLAKISASRVDIDPGSHQSKVALTLDSGPEISFGALDIRGLVRYRVPAAQILAGYHPGTPYKLQSLQTMQSALEQSGLFSSVQVRSDLQRVSQGQVPVVIELSEIARKKLDLGLTYDTDVGGGTRIGYEQYNLFDRGWTGSALWSWNRSEQSLSFGLSLPPSSDGYVNSLTAQLKKTDIQGVATSAQSLGVWHTLTDERSELRFGSQFLVESRSVDGVPTQTSHALLPSVGWTRRAVDNLIHPQSGWLLDGSLAATPGSLLSSTQFTRAYGRGAVYWTPHPSWGTWVARVEWGQVWSDNVNQVPESQLFRAGGVNSVRGYDYESLGVAGPNGSVLGGAVLATGSLEYQIPVTSNVALALFSDAGDAAGNWHSYRIQRSQGIGVRWFSPVAPLSCDLSQALGKASIMLNISLGLAF